MDVWNIPSVVSGHIILAFLFGSVPLPQIITVHCWGEKHTLINNMSTASNVHVSECPFCILEHLADIQQQ